MGEENMDFDIILDEDYYKRQRHSPNEKALNYLKEKEATDEIKCRIRQYILDAVVNITNGTANANTQTVRKYGAWLETNIKKVLEKSKFKY